MKKLLGEFRDFISKGDVMNLAVGVIIGAAFGAIVTSLVNDILSPIIGLFADTKLDDLVWTIGGVNIGYGAFLTALINFLIMALVLFFIVKGVRKAQEYGEKIRKRGQEEAPAVPTTKVCPFCRQEIAIDATRCPHCTSHLEEK